MTGRTNRWWSIKIVQFRETVGCQQLFANYILSKSGFELVIFKEAIGVALAV
jgi:hypothetical protein